MKKLGDVFKDMWIDLAEEVLYRLALFERNFSFCLCFHSHGMRRKPDLGEIKCSGKVGPVPSPHQETFPSPHKQERMAGVCVCVCMCVYALGCACVR